MAYYKATCLIDPRSSFEREDFYQFSKLAMLGIKTRGWDAWSFEGGGVELDPVFDLEIPESLRLLGSN
jgi:hypothetical protein